MKQLTIVTGKSLKAINTGCIWVPQAPSFKSDSPAIG